MGTHSRSTNGERRESRGLLVLFQWMVFCYLARMTVCSSTNEERNPSYFRELLFNKASDNNGNITEINNALDNNNNKPITETAADEDVNIQSYFKYSDAKRNSVIPMPRFGRSSVLEFLDGSSEQRSKKQGSIIPMMRYGKRMQKKREDNIIPYPRPGRQAEAQFDVIKVYETASNYLTDGGDSLNADFENENLLIQTEDNRDTNIPDVNYNEIFHSTENSVSKQDQKRQNTQYVLPQMRYGRSVILISAPKSNDKNPKSQTFVLPYPRPGKRSARIEGNLKNKNVNNVMLPYPRPGRSEFEDFEIRKEKRQGYMTPTARLGRSVADKDFRNEETNVKSTNLGFLGLKVIPYSFMPETKKKPDKPKDAEDKYFVIPYPRPGKRDMSKGEGKDETSSDALFEEILGSFKENENSESKRSNFVIPYSRTGRDYGYMLPYPRPGRDYGDMLPYPRPGRDYGDMIPYPRPGRSNGVQRMKRSDSVVPYPRPGKRNSVVPYPRLGRNSVVPYPRPGRSNSVVPYPRLGKKSGSVLPYPRPGRLSDKQTLETQFYDLFSSDDDSEARSQGSGQTTRNQGNTKFMLPNLRPGRSNSKDINNSILPYPRPGRSGKSQFMLPYPRTGRRTAKKSKSSVIIPYPRLGRSPNSAKGYVVPHPRIGRSEDNRNETDLSSDTVIPYPRLGRNEVEVNPIPKPLSSAHKLNKHMLQSSGESVYLLPYPRPGRLSE